MGHPEDEGNNKKQSCESNLIGNHFRGEIFIECLGLLNKSNRRSCGLSSETIADFESHLQKNIAFISQQLKQGAYKFSSVRGVLIEKPGKTDKRPLRISEVRDRLVLKLFP
ncbi:MAG: hypothetical protein IPK08_10090 [Bacteroidetes bacterium]|nr:hypothetical protein [Bacteroidota bacterium]